MDFGHVHFYAHDSLPCIDRVVTQVAKVFPSCKIDVKAPLPIPDIERARISDIKQPFECQPTKYENFDLDGRQVALYDGFELQGLLARVMTSSGNAQIVLTDRLACTFSEADWHYHARTVICGTPAIISTTGIVEAPARPREFYAPFADIQSLKKKHAGRFIDYGDERMADATAGCALQALFFLLTDGEPFCDRDGCRLFSAHWQHDLIRTQVEDPALCPKHSSLAEKFNSRLARKKRT